jgi:hypothetical protein
VIFFNPKSALELIFAILNKEQRAKNKDRFAKRQKNKDGFV